MAVTIESGKMDQVMMDAFLAQPHIARFATANPKTGQPHVVPVWYEWDGASMWISSFSSTRKIRELKQNPLCSVVVDTAGGGFTQHAVLMEGRGELVTGPTSFLVEKITQVYLRYLGPQGVLHPDPQEWIHDPQNLLIRLTPQHLSTWYTVEIA